MTLSTAQMRSLPAVFLGIDDPRRQGRRPRPAHGPRARRRRDAVRHARLQGDRRLARRLSPRGLQRFRVRRRDGRDRPPGLSTIRSLLIRVDPARRDAALRSWPTARATARWPSTARPSAAPSMTMANRLMCPASQATTPRQPGVKTSRHEARRRRWREAHQRDRHRHPPARDGARHRGPHRHRRCPACRARWPPVGSTAARTPCSPSRETRRPGSTTSGSLSTRSSPGARRTSRTRTRSPSTTASRVQADRYSVARWQPNPPPKR